MRRLLLATAITFATACHAVAPVAPVPVHGYVNDMAAFDAFIGTHPTVEQFRAAYPDVKLVLPGHITTMEFRRDNSRYFATLDDAGRITGGHFG